MLFLGGKIASNAASVDVVLCMHRVLLTFADAVGAGAMYADAAYVFWTIQPLQRCPSLQRKTINSLRAKC